MRSGERGTRRLHGTDVRESPRKGRDEERTFRQLESGVRKCGELAMRAGEQGKLHADWCEAHRSQCSEYVAHS